MIRRLGLIQPGKIGDIIICLPIAKWYYDKGYEIIWPIDANLIDNFKGYVDYVNFHETTFDCNAAYDICRNNNCNTILDLSFTIPGANQHNSDLYLSQTKYSFDEFKYVLADIPIEQKWNLSINRNESRENILRDILKIDSPYVVIQENSSDCRRGIDWMTPEIRRIDIEPLTSSIFDWLGVLEDAEHCILIESCFTNLVDQIKLSTKSLISLEKLEYSQDKLDDGRFRRMPILKSNWSIL